jgi:hypothetical protein
MEFTAFPIVFQGHRHWSPGISGLAFAGVTVGAFLALAVLMFYINPAYAKAHQKNGYMPPEARLPGAIAGGFLLP